MAGAGRGLLINVLKGLIHGSIHIKENRKWLLRADQGKGQMNPFTPNQLEIMDKLKANEKLYKLYMTDSTVHTAIKMSLHNGMSWVKMLEALVIVLACEKDNLFDQCVKLNATSPPAPLYKGAK